jgi:lipoprotein-anchoring transpeptidase ErfK/SrfK
LKAVTPGAIVRVFNGKSLQLENEFRPFEDIVTNEFNIATGDLDGDGLPEVVIGAGFGYRPEVEIFRLDGTAVGQFLAYNPAFTGGVRILVIDLDNDGKAEIVTGPGPGGGPHVRIFDISGQPKISPGFMAFDSKYLKGITLAAGDVNQDGQKEIIVARTYDNPQTEIKVFDKTGKDLKLGFVTSNYIKSLDLNLAAGDFGADQQVELVVNGGYGLTSQVDLRQIDGHLINSWEAFSHSFSGGVNLAVGDIDGDGQREVVAGAGFLGGPHVKIFDSYGRLEKEFFAFDSSFRGGVKVAVVDSSKKSDAKIVVVSDRLSQIADQSGHSIEVNAGVKQTLRVNDDGFWVKDFLISSGTGYLHTPLGEFKIWRKRPDVHMFGPGYDLPHVPWVLSFQGPYTIHGTYWHSNFGHPMSHGCINMYTPDAKWLYDWADIGTPVKIYQ